MTTATVNNIGNVDIKPTLTLKINTLNDETVFNSTDIDMIFPENSSELADEWPDTPTFGIYSLITSVNILGKIKSSRRLSLYYQVGLFYYLYS